MLILCFQNLCRRNEVLARLYLARADVAYTVRTAALHVWKTVVTNTPKTLIEILPVLMDRVIGGLSEEDEERRTSAGQCLGELVRKLGDRVLSQIVPILIEGSYSPNPSTRIGVCNGMREVASNATRNQLTDHMADLLGEIQRLLCDENDDVREASGGLFDIMFKTGGGSAAESIIPSLLTGLGGDEEKASKSLEGLRIVLGVRPQLLSAIIPSLVDPPLSRRDVTALGALAEVAGSSIHPFLPKLMVPLFKLVQEKEMAETAKGSLLAISMSVEEDGLQTFISQIQRGFDSTDSVLGACETVSLFAKNTALDFQEHVGGLLGVLIPLLADGSSSERLKAAWNAISATTNTIPKDMLPTFVRPVKDAVSAANERAVRIAKQTTTLEVPIVDGVLPGLSLPKALSPFVPIYLQGILQGSSAELREIAAEAMGELVHLTSETTLKPFVIQITGPLIRIVGDRFPWQTKSAILHTMGILVDKAGPALRPFIPQLQTTFVKCLPDPARTVRMEGAANLGKLSGMAPRLDQLVSDIAGNSLQATVDGAKEAYLSALGNILKISGSRVSETTMEKVSEAVTEGAESALQADDEMCVRAAAMLLGEYAKICSSLGFQRIMKSDSFGLIGSHIGTNIGSRLLIALFATNVAELAATKLRDEDMLLDLLKMISLLAKDTSVDVRMAASVTCGRIVLSELSSGLPSSIDKVINILIAHLGLDQHVEVQKQALGVLRRISQEDPNALEPHFVALIPSLISLTKDSTGGTKLAAERTLSKILQVEHGDTMVSGYLSRQDIGVLAKQTITEPYIRRLTRIVDTEVDDLADYAI